MTSLFAAFNDAAGRPNTGVVVLVPKQMRSSVLEEGILGPSRITLPLDSRGEIEEEIDPGDYRVDIRLKNAETVSREISVPWSDEPIDLRGLLDEYEPSPSEFTSEFGQGMYTYGIPWWAASIDVILLGGGGGGDDGVTLASGQGGRAGGWLTTTLVRGVDIPWESTTINGYVGGGGAHNEGNGEATTATAVGMTLVSATGGAGGGNGSGNGQSAGTRTVNSKLYSGGATVTTLGQAGNYPGGGGAGGPALNNLAGAGAAGRAWFRAYR